MKQFKLNFDGKGINDKTSEYSPRLATFTQAGLDEPGLGELFEVSPMMLQVLKNIISSAPIRGLSLAMEKDIQDAISIVRHLEGK